MSMLFVGFEPRQLMFCCSVLVFNRNFYICRKRNIFRFQTLKSHRNAVNTCVKGSSQRAFKYTFVLRTSSVSKMSRSNRWKIKLLNLNLEFFLQKCIDLWCVSRSTYNIVVVVVVVVAVVVVVVAVVDQKKADDKQFCSSDTFRQRRRVLRNDGPVIIITNNFIKKII